MNNNLDITKSECIIIGGGTSISEGISLGLKEKIKNKFVIACNYAYKYFEHTFLCFQDKNFYVPDYAKNYVNKNVKRHPDIYAELKQESLIIGINNNGIDEFKLNNTILLDKKYRKNLTGIFALEILNLLNFQGNVYLLGFDWTRRTDYTIKNIDYNPNSDLNIHYYNDIKHKGSGYVGYYENHNPDKEFNKYIQNKNLKIYNISLDSNIKCFEKIDYNQLFTQLSIKQTNQLELRKYISTKLKN